MQKARHGLFIGRMQPIHFGHMHVINKIFDDGLEPIIILGSSQEKRDVNKNPLTFEERVELIRLAYNNRDDIFYVRSEDFDSDREWLEDILERTRDITNGNVVLYYHEKPNDMKDVRIGSVHYSTYGQMFESAVLGMEVKFIEPYIHPGINEAVSATMIRKDFKNSRCLMPEPVYNKLKEWGWK
jgi:cytidyltransferase-like protein